MILKVSIDEAGAVRKVTVVQSAGHGFDDSATEALYRFKFSPACSTLGRPMAVQILYRYQFRLRQ